MTRRPTASIVANPVLVGAVTVLVTIVAVTLGYNANRGLPFVPTLDVSARATNAEAVGRGSEIREGGFRVGFVEKVEPVRLPSGEGGARIQLKLDGKVRPLPVDSTFTIRPRSPLGLKYLELARGTARKGAGDGHVFPEQQVEIPVQVDEVTSTYDRRTRRGVQGSTEGFGDALAGRGTYLNEVIADLPRLLPLVEAVAANLSDPQTQLPRFLRELGDAARVLAPVAAIQADLFTRAAQTFEAFSRDPEALKATISLTHPALEAGIRSFPVQRPFLTDSAALAREMRPVARELRPTLPRLNDALEVGVPVVRRSLPFYARLKPVFGALRALAEDPATGIALRGLTANVSTLRPQLRFLAPYQTVCNYWNYFLTYLAEHLSQEGPLGYSQRVLLRSTGQQNNSLGSLGSAEPANGEGYVAASAPRGKAAYLHGQAYSGAVDPRGEADCENGQRGYLRRLSSLTESRFEIVTDAHIPGNQGPTYRGRPRVPKGQTFTPEPETGAGHP